MRLPTAVINYTLSTKEDPSLVHPCHVISAGQVIKHIMDESYEMSHISSFIIVGHSAGAHLAALLVINSTYLDLAYRLRIHGMVGVDGIFLIL
jgi:acetyl esterase/lipase